MTLLLCLACGVVGAVVGVVFIYFAIATAFMNALWR